MIAEPVKPCIILKILPAMRAVDVGLIIQTLVARLHIPAMKYSIAEFLHLRRITTLSTDVSRSPAFADSFSS
jgi:hypothetical protein